MGSEPARPEARGFVLFFAIALFSRLRGGWSRGLRSDITFEGSRLPLREMATDANLLLVSNGSVPERIRAELEAQGALVESTSPAELAITFQVVGPDLVVHFGFSGAQETVDFLRSQHDGRPVRLVLVGARADLSPMRKLDRKVVLGVLADDMPEPTICERILSLASRKQEPPRVLSVPSAKVPSVPPDVLDPHLQRPAAPVLPPQPLPPPGFERRRVFETPSTPPPSEEKILTWLRSTPPPRISEKENAEDLPGAVWGPGDDPLEAVAELEPGFGSLPNLEHEQSAGEFVPDGFAASLDPSEERGGPELRGVAPQSGDSDEEDADDRDTLMMDIDPSMIESEDAVADRETVQMLTEVPFEAQEPSVSSVVTDTSAAQGALSGAKIGASGRSWFRWGLVAGIPLLAGLLLISFSGQKKAQSPEKSLSASDAGLVSAEKSKAPPSDPAIREIPPTPDSHPNGVDPWVRPENPSVPECDVLLGDKEGLRLGDVDQSALVWKRARGKLVLGDREGAHAELCRAAYIFPSGLAVEALIEQLLDMDAPRKAEPFMEQALKARPHRPKTLELRGDLLSQLGEHERARTIWIEALGLTETTPKVLSQVARQIVAQAETVLAGGQVGLAERLLRRAATLDRASSAALLGLSHIEELRGDSVRANAFRDLADRARSQ